MENIFSANLTTAEILEQSVSVMTQLTIATDTNGTSLLPSELSTTNTILSKLIDVLESSVSMGTAPANEVHVFDILYGLLGHRAIKTIPAGHS